ncbi:MAG: hypothetical protein R3B70_45355 [Polyangiaceae bacterium]
MRAVAHALALTSLASLVLACSAPAATTTSPMMTPPTGVTGVSSSTDVERYFPLIDGTVFHYETTNESGGKGVLIARAHRTDATHGELVFPTGKKRFVYTSGGVILEPDGGFVLASPIAPGATFRGQNGGRAVIDDTAVVIDVRAGSFRDCVRVVEERGGDRRARYSTTFCPDVGIVAIEAEAGTTYERADLVYTGPPVDIERDGLTVTPAPPPPQ